ncbi:MAG: hypothetical protein JWQ97_985 [Phenylobacterium sp.]|nr:hypothetical protein [Phenylobacterium sp.]
MPDAYTQALPTPNLTAQLARVEVTGRWVAAKKQILLELLRRNALTLEQACARYDLSVEEVVAWRERDAMHGRKGLAATKLQEVGRG